MSIITTRTTTTCWFQYIGIYTLVNRLHQAGSLCVLEILVVFTSCVSLLRGGVRDGAGPVGYFRMSCFTYRVFLPIRSHLAARILWPIPSVFMLSGVRREIFDCRGVLGSMLGNETNVSDLFALKAVEATVVWSHVDVETEAISDLQYIREW